MTKDKLGRKATEDQRIENVLENGYSIDLFVNIKLVLNWAKHVKKLFPCWGKLKINCKCQYFDWCSIPLFTCNLSELPLFVY